MIIESFPFSLHYFIHFFMFIFEYQKSLWKSLIKVVRKKYIGNDSPAVLKIDIYITIMIKPFVFGQILTFYFNQAYFNF